MHKNYILQPKLIFSCYKEKKVIPFGQNEICSTSQIWTTLWLYGVCIERSRSSSLEIEYPPACYNTWFCEGKHFFQILKKCCKSVLVKYIFCLRTNNKKIMLNHFSHFFLSGFQKCHSYIEAFSFIIILGQLIHPHIYTSV